LDVARELRALLDRPDWKPDDKARLSARIQNLLATVTRADHPDAELLDDDLHAATESQLFAILDEELGS
jgi:polyketide synthase 7